MHRGPAARRQSNYPGSRLCASHTFSLAETDKAASGARFPHSQPSNRDGRSLPGRTAGQTAPPLSAQRQTDCAIDDKQNGTASAQRTRTMPRTPVAREPVVRSSAVGLILPAICVSDPRSGEKKTGCIKSA